MRVYAAVLALLLAGCGTTPVKQSIDVPSGSKLEQAESSRLSKAAASIEAANYANGQNPEGPPKAATAQALSVGLAWTGPAQAVDRAEFMKMVNEVLSGELDKAQATADALRSDAARLNAEIIALKASKAAELAAQKAEFERQLKEAKDEAKKARDRLIIIFTIGLGGLLIAGGVVMLVLAGKFAAIYPAFGPKSAFAIMGAGGALVATGIAVNAIERALDRHPAIVYSGMGVAALLAIAGVVLVYANHVHANDQKQ